MARIRAELTTVLESTPEMAFSNVPQSGWTGAQIIQHLGQAEGSIAKLLEGLFAKALEDGLPEDTETSSLLRALDHLGVPDRTRRRIVAPSRLEPPRDSAVAASWESLQRVRERTLRAVASVDGRDLSRLAAPHPVFGPIDGYQWVLFVGQHEARHLGQLRDVLQLASRDGPGV